MEEWRTIVDYPDYAVSNLGRVKRIQPDWQGKYLGTVLKGSWSRGYHRVILRCNGSSKTIGVHRIVCEAWHGKMPADKDHAAHRNGVKADNTPENLYWATAQENIDDRTRHGTTATGNKSGARLHPEKWSRGDNHWTRKNPEAVLRGDLHPRRLRPETVPRGEDANNVKLSESDVIAIKAAEKYHGVGRDLAQRFNVSMGLISSIRSGRAWAHIGKPL